MRFTSGSAIILKSECVRRQSCRVSLATSVFQLMRADVCCRYRNLKAERRKEIKAREAAVRLAHRKSRGATIPEDADAHGREPPRLLILYGTQVHGYAQTSTFKHAIVPLCADSFVLQTGNARSFAMEMFEEASERGFFATCLDMEVHAMQLPSLLVFSQVPHLFCRNARPTFCLRTKSCLQFVPLTSEARRRPAQFLFLTRCSISLCLCLSKTSDFLFWV